MRSSKASFTCDIMNFDYKQFPPGYFDIIHASPPCTQYSYARSTGPPRDLEGANRIVKKTLEIIEYFMPRRWCLENPYGHLRKQVFMLDKPFMTLDYCQFSTKEDHFPYRKRTCIWSDEIRPNKMCHQDCAEMDERKKGHVGTFCGVRNLCLSKKYRIPQGLFDYVFL